MEKINFFCLGSELSGFTTHCWSQDRVFQQPNVAGPAQNPAQTAVPKFTSTSYFIRSDKSVCPPGIPAVTHSHATQTHPNKHQFNLQHTHPTVDSTIHRSSFFPLCRARWGQPGAPSLPDKQLLQRFVQHNKAGSV